MPPPHRRSGYSAEQFEADYLARSQRHYPELTLESLRAHKHVVECGEQEWGCDDPECPGWAMVPLAYETTNG